MRTASPLRLVAGVVLAAVFGACSSPTDVTDQLDVRLSIDRTVITPGNPARVTVVVKNRGPRAVATAAPQSYNCGRPFVVHDLNDRELTLPSRVCSLADYAPVILSTGDSVVIVDHWSGDESTGSGTGAKPVAAGQYRVRAQVMTEQAVATSVATTVRYTP